LIRGAQSLRQSVYDPADHSVLITDRLTRDPADLRNLTLTLCIVTASQEDDARSRLRAPFFE
jgi:hypothetical protein